LFRASLPRAARDASFGKKANQLRSYTGRTVKGLDKRFPLFRRGDELAFVRKNMFRLQTSAIKDEVCHAKAARLRASADQFFLPVCSPEIDAFGSHALGMRDGHYFPHSLCTYIVCHRRARVKVPFEVKDLTVNVDGTVAYSYSSQHYLAKTKAGGSKGGYTKPHLQVRRTRFSLPFVPPADLQAACAHAFCARLRPLAVTNHSRIINVEVGAGPAALPELTDVGGASRLAGCELGCVAARLSGQPCPTVRLGSRGKDGLDDRVRISRCECASFRLVLGNDAARR